MAEITEEEEKCCWRRVWGGVGGGQQSKEARRWLRDFEALPPLVASLPVCWCGRQSADSSAPYQTPLLVSAHSGYTLSWPRQKKGLKDRHFRSAQVLTQLEQKHGCYVAALSLWTCWRRWLAHIHEHSVINWWSDWQVPQEVPAACSPPPPHTHTRSFSVYLLFFQVPLSGLKLCYAALLSWASWQPVKTGNSQLGGLLLSEDFSRLCCLCCSATSRCSCVALKASRV